LTDAFVLATLGGTSGILVASWLLPVIFQLAPPSVPRLEEVAINVRVVMFGAVMATATGLLVGLIPLRRVVDGNLAGNLRTSERTGTGRDGTIRGVLVTAQLALTVACLGTAGLILQSLTNVLRVEPGFNWERVVAVEASMSPDRYPNTEAKATFARQVVQRINGVPGVEYVGVANRLPFRGSSMTTMLVVEGSEGAPIPMIERPQADVRSVDRGYFRALDIPLVNGELFDESNRAVAIVSRSMATRAWPGEDPIGKRFRLGAQPRRLIEVIGVAEDVRNMGLESNPSLTVYLPYSQFFVHGMSFTVRTTMDPAAVATLVRSAIAEIDRDVPIDSARSMGHIIGDSVTTRRFQAMVLTVLGGLAVILAAIGVFGVMAYVVVQRSKEFGIRLAIGASPRSLQQMVLRNALGLIFIGLAVGAPLAIAAGYALRHMLFGVKPASPVTLAAACGLVVVISIAATVVPARRAARVDPLVALRYE
jgi:predicted permease